MRRRCINPRCQRPSVRPVFLDEGFGDDLRMQARCETCGCSGPSVELHDVFDLDLGDEEPTVSDAVTAIRARSLELWDDMVRRMEPGKILGQIAAEARRAAQ